MKILSYLDNKGIDTIAAHVYLMEKVCEGLRKRYKDTTDERKLARLKKAEELYEATLLYGEQVASEYFMDEK
jgi:hypothetical protein